MSIHTVTAVATGDEQPVHPAAQQVLDAIAALAAYRPTSPQDAALLLRSLGGDGLGRQVWGPSAVNDLMDVMVGIAGTVRRDHPEAAAAAVYAEDALSVAREEWLDGTTGEFAVCQAASVLERPHVAAPADFRSQYLDEKEDE